ncbi:MAG: HIT family protein [Chloroflexales bacterium]|nr:HIT family protein [Chloroflexales bacterium]
MKNQQSTWDEFVQGEGCSLCQPREQNNEYRREIAQLAISTLYLFADQRFRGYCLLIFDPYHATGIEQLTEDEYNVLMKDLRRAAQAIRFALNPAHMNYESLGNSSPHIHWHIIPRYKHDRRWEQPIWEGWAQRNEFVVNRLALPEQEYQEIIDAIRFTLKERE